MFPLPLSSPPHLSSQVVLLPASTSNPGIPPSSLTSFLRHKPSIKGVVIEEFNTNFSNTYYQSEADTTDGIFAQPILAAGETRQGFPLSLSPSHCLSLLHLYAIP